MSNATLDRPAPQKTAATPALGWTTNEGLQVGRDGPARALARLGFHTDGGSLDAVAEATRDAVETMILAPLRERVAALPSVRRYGALRREQAAVRAELDDVEVSLQRASGERDEVLHFARPGFAQRLAALDAEIADLSSRKAEIDARHHALSGPVGDARALAEGDAEASRLGVHGEAAHVLHDRRMALAARLGPLVAPVLTEMLGINDALHGCAAGIACHGQEVVRDLNRIAEAAAVGA